MACEKSCCFVVFILLTCTPRICCKRYDLAQGWRSSTAGDDSRKFQDADSMGNYHILHAESQDELLLSDKGTFGLTFFNLNGTDNYYLCVIMATPYFTNMSTSASGVIVWTANRNTPISGNGSLVITDRGTLELLGSDGKIIWSPRTSSSVSGLKLQESGELIAYNSTGKSIWKSFHEPTDAVLEGQPLYTGHKLSSTSVSMGIGEFQVHIDRSGLGFFLQLPGKAREPYFLWPLWNQGNAPSEMSSIGMECPTYKTILFYNASQISMTYQKKKRFGGGETGNFSKCGPDLTTPVSSGNSLLRYLKLDNTGALVQRIYHQENATWTTNAALVGLLNPCLPMGCPPHSVCTATGQCQCLKAAAAATENNSSATKCQPTSDIPLVCNELEAENHHFLNVSRSTYFSNRYTRATRISSLDDCWNLCLSNCSCQAFFYNEGSSSCYFVKEVHGSLTTDASTSAFLKQQNSKLVLPSSSSKSQVLKLALGLAGGGVLSTAIIGLAALSYWKRQMEQIRGTLAAALQGAPRRYSYKELKLATGKFSSILGAGGSGPVYQGVLQNGERVAIKNLENSDQGEKEFVAEVNTIGSISHLNIVKLCGYCASGPHRMLVYEHVANGSLDKWLFGESGEEAAVLGWRARYAIALGTARGLSYLHEESRLLIMHLDVKPQNILLDEQFVAKVADFGIAKVMANRQTSQATTTVRGTPGYFAPEWLLNSVATKKCDVYSYGMVLLELIGGRRNLEHKTFSSRAVDDEDYGWYFPARVVEKLRQGRILDVVDKRLVNDLDEEMKVEVTRLVKVALWCVQGNPTDRPSMDVVVQMLEGHKEVLEPPMSFHFAIQCPGVINISTSLSSSNVPVVSMSQI